MCIIDMAAIKHIKYLHCVLYYESLQPNLQFTLLLSK